MSRRIALFGALALSSLSRTGAAQTEPARLTLRAVRTELSARAGDGSTVTGVFIVTNGGDDTVRVESALAVPAGWTAVIGNGAFRMAPRATDTWIVTAVAPPDAVAGSYRLHATVIAPGAIVRDSVTVSLAERRALELVAVDIPDWATAGDDYRARFVLRNRGNVETTVALTARSSRGLRFSVDRPALTLPAGGTGFVTVSVTSGRGTRRAGDDVVELFATDITDPRVRATASTRTTIVPGEAAFLDGMTTLPATLTLRAAGAAAGVAPVVFTAAGFLPDEKTFADLSFHAPTPWRSPLSERGEIRLALRSDRMTVRLGDDVFGFTPLTSNAALGFGAQVEGTNGRLSAGAYLQRARTTPNAPVEEGAFIGTSNSAPFQVAGTLVTRAATGAPRAVIASARGGARLPGGGLLAVELASSDSANVHGVAERARLTGEVGSLGYDVGHLRGSRSFAGPMRALAVDDALLTVHASSRLSFRASGATQVVTPDASTTSGPGRRFSTATVGASWAGRTIVEYRWLGRRDDSWGGAASASQRGVRATQLMSVGAFMLSADLERGTATDPARGSVRTVSERGPRDYTSVGGSMRVALGSAGTLSLYAERTDGNALGADGGGSVSGGGSLQLALPLGAQLDLWGTALSQRQPVPLADPTRTRIGQFDVQLAMPVSWGATVALRAHLWQNPTLQGTDRGNAVYFELRTPLRIPTGRVRESGRVEGRVTDARTGVPVGGALVRVGDQASVTDRDGRVSFTGLAPARYHVSLDAKGPAAGALLVGDVVVHVLPHAKKPATFAVSLTRGARVHATVRRFERQSTLDAGRDSLLDAGGVPDALVALEGARDTLYQTSDADGRLDFGDLAPGRWVLTIHSAGALAQPEYQSERVTIVVADGERRDLVLRLVPRRRPVTFIESGPELRAVAAPMSPARR